MIQRTEAEILLKKYVEGTATDEERALLEAWYLKHELKDLPQVSEAGKYDQMERIRAKLAAHSSVPESSTTPVRIWYRIAVAASVILAVSVGVYFFMHKPAATQRIVQSKPRDLAPGSDKAVLTLADGKQIPVGGAKASLLAYQGNTRINLTSGNEVIYSPGEEKRADKMQYNTLSTPRGGQYAMILSDGTKVWLDAASSITFPVSFTTKSRDVKIKGQVYFEVARKAGAPFKVAAGSQTVEVLGTSFNINAYNDEPAVKTTLLDGSIKISAPGSKVILKPGQQALTSESKISVTTDAGVDEAIAWHKGMFEFHDADIKTMMRQLARWYNVDVSYEGKITDRRFSGKIYRNLSALKVSDILSYKDIHFRIEGEKIIVMP